MKKLLLLLLLITYSVFAQKKVIWTKISSTTIAENKRQARSAMPVDYALFNFDFALLKKVIVEAPMRNTAHATSDIAVSFPDPNGNVSDYKIFENPIMEAGLANRYKHIKTYIGISITNPSNSIYFSITDFGLHVISYSNDSSTFYIDNFSKDNNAVLVYYKKDAVANRQFSCDVTQQFERNASDIISSNAFRASDGKFRIYRLAMACTIEYAAFHVNAAGLATGTLLQKKAAVLSAMVVSMTRINGLFEKDMSLRMNLVANNDAIIFIDTDTFDNTNANTLINQSQTVIDATIGAANYDIGHTVSTGGGGLAQLYSPCSASKARGITGQSAPVGDPFDIDYVAHEMGHQFGANHTQNNNCNRASVASVEPGSASTIMGYAGICAPNVQSNSDAHFHAVSIAEMSAFLAAGGGSCPTTTNNGNFAPIVNAGLDYTIPKGTAFVLKGNATDANNDLLTYCWEQTNPEVSTQPPTNTATSGPNFRSLAPQTSPNRYFPNFSSILAGNLSPTWEVVPNVARTMNFALTVRDNRMPNGGQTGRDNMLLTVANVGPFVITAPNTNVSWLAGSNQNITWDVAGTTANGVNCQFVDILLSTDGGATFATLLASKVPNDGLELISIPNVIGNTNRIMVRGTDHLFLDVTNANFTIAASPSTFGLSFSGLENGQNKSVCQGSAIVFDLNYVTLAGFNSQTTLSIIGNPLGSTVAFSQNPIVANGLVSVTIGNTQLCAPGFYTLTVSAVSGASTKNVNLYLEVLNSSFGIVQLSEPSADAFAIPTTTTLNWIADPAATNYEVQVANDADFTSIFQNQTVATTSFELSGLQELKNYFWRVLPKNTGCFGTYSDMRRFTTGQTLCTTSLSANVPVAISGGAPATVVSKILVANGVQISDINIAAQITHSWIADLTITLTSPTGTIVQLVNGQCGNGDNLNATFDDAGSTLLCGVNPAIGGTIKPSELLSAFNGQNSAGEWTLSITDNESGDGGSLTNWSLNICTIPNVPIVCGQITTTWTGTSWTNGKPVDNVQTTIAGNYSSTGDLTACELNITATAQVVLNSDHNLTVKAGVTVANTATLTLENNANLIQIDNVANSGTITVKRNTTALKRLDYVNWSTPVTGTKTLKQFSPLTLNNRFYGFNTATNLYNVIPDPINTTFATAKGYLIRMPDNHPTTATIFNGEFVGTPNNGSIDVNLIYSSAVNKYNLIGNPYPSTISASALLAANTASIGATLYFWRKTNAAAGTAYATYTLGGATTTSPTSAAPNGTIQVGQGFLVETKNVTNPKVTFTNGLRITNTANQFFRLDNTIPNDKIWLNLTDANDAFCQMLVSYFSNATNGVDDGFDAKGIDDSDLRLSSLIDNEAYTIQGRAPFLSSDSVPIGFKTASIGDYTIAIDHLEGLFEGSQAIFLKDNLMQSLHNLKTSPYTFSTTAGEFNARFELIFQDTSLATAAVAANQNLIVATANNQIKINATNATIEKVLVFDLLGRQLFDSEKITTSQFLISSIAPKTQALIVKVTMVNGITETRKIIF